MAEDLEIRYNPKKVKEFWNKYNLTIIILLLIPIFLAGFFRAYTYDLPITEDWAESTIRGSVQNQISANIQQQYPDIDEQNLNNLISQQTNLYFKENEDQIKAQKAQLKDQLKTYYQDEDGQTYLLAIDPWYYHRQAENLLENGHVGDIKVEGQSIDTHMLAPNGKPVINSLHPTVIVLIHRISQVFGNDSLMKSTFIVPMLISMLAVIPCFFIGRRLGGNITGVVAAVLLAIHPILLGRTPAGFSDTDAYNVFFPLLITWIFMEGLITKKVKHKTWLAIGAGFATGLFAFAWYGWWYIFDIILGAIILYLIYLIIKHKKAAFKLKTTKKFLLVAIIYFISSIVFITIFTGFSATKLMVEGPLSAVFIKQAAHTSLWPNVYTTVAELNTVSVIGIISVLGGKILFALAIIGILLTLLKKKQKEIKPIFFLILTIWFVIAIYASTKGMRFTLLLLPPFVFGVGLTISYLFTKLRKWINRDLEINKKFITTVFIIALIILAIPWINRANDTGKNEVPSMNDGWYAALSKIKQETPEDSIVNSWWDFGHWFKAIADRAVTFDGASQNQPQAHWIGKVLLTNNEEEAIAILRMLDCGANDAYNLLLEETNSALETKRTLDEALLLSKSEARILISEHTDDPDKILEKIFCNPPEDYFITSQDMVSKAGVWAHFGSWNFERSFAYNEVRSKQKQEAIESLKENLGNSQEEAESTYRQLKGVSDVEANGWIAGYPGYGTEGVCQTQNNTVLCTNGAKIDLENNVATISTTNGEIVIKVWRDDKGTYTAEEGTEEIILAYIPEQSKSIFMQPALMNSMFTELYYYRGKRLNNFELFDHQQGVNGFNIYTWKVKW